MNVTTRKPVDLQELLDEQRQLMNLLGVPSVLPEGVVHSPLYKDTLIQLAGEVQEALEPLTLGSKPWKWATDEALLAETTVELTDCLFYVMEAFLMLGMDAQAIAEAYRTKREEVVGRIMARAR